MNREEFAHMPAVAILFPYARHHIAMLTQSTPYGPTHLPSINVAALMKDFLSSDDSEGGTASSEPMTPSSQSTSALSGPQP
jgi:preprotein translocase subunit SecB